MESIKYLYFFSYRNSILNFHSAIASAPRTAVLFRYSQNTSVAASKVASVFT